MLYSNQVNDFVRDKLKKKKKNTMPIWCEVMAGASAGASQVAVTNPVEIVKIRLQVAGEMHIRGKIGGWSVLKELGFSGLYKVLKEYICSLVIKYTAKTSVSKG